jgi:hypothetical protein
VLSPEERDSLQREARDPQRREAFRRAHALRPARLTPEGWLRFLSAATSFFPPARVRPAHLPALGERYLL